MYSLPSGRWAPLNNNFREGGAYETILNLIQWQNYVRSTSLLSGGGMEGGGEAHMRQFPI